MHTAPVLRGMKVPGGEYKVRRGREEEAWSARVLTGRINAEPSSERREATWNSRNWSSHYDAGCR